MKVTMETTDSGLRVEVDDAALEAFGRVGAGIAASLFRLSQIPVVGLRFEHGPRKPKGFSPRFQRELRKGGRRGKG